MVDTIRPMGELVGRSGPPAQRLYLRLPCREDPRLRKVKLALSFFPGESQAVLYFEDCKKRVGTRCQIHPRPGGGPEGASGRGKRGGQIVCTITKMLCLGTVFL